MSAQWILVNVGCIECGVSTQIVGVFSDRGRAEALRDEFDVKFNWREGGQNDFQVYEMPEIDVVHPEYAPDDRAISTAEDAP